MNEIQDVLAWRSARPLEGHDALDLLQPEPEAPRLRDEPEEGQGLGSVHTVARSGAARGREDAGLLVETECLPADAALCRYLSDQQAVACHVSSLNPAPEGKVKRIFTEGPRPAKGAGARARQRVAMRVGAGTRMVDATTSPDSSVSTATTWMAAPRPMASATRPESSAPTA